MTELRRNRSHPNNWLVLSGNEAELALYRIRFGFVLGPDSADFRQKLGSFCQKNFALLASRPLPKLGQGYNASSGKYQVIYALFRYYPFRNGDTRGSMG